MSNVENEPAMSMQEFEAIAADAFAGLPKRFRASCANVAILVEEFPSSDVHRDMGLESPYDLLGLYDGVDIVTRSLDGWDGPPDVILLYRSPILAYADAEGFTARDVISHVLIHEIGHHMGFSDQDMEEMEAEASAGAENPAN